MSACLPSTRGNDARGQQWFIDTVTEPEFCEALLTGEGPDWLGTAGTPGLEGLDGFEEDEDSDIGFDLDTSGDRTR